MNQPLSRVGWLFRFCLAFWLQYCTPSSAWQSIEPNELEGPWFKSTGVHRDGSGLRFGEAAVPTTTKRLLALPPMKRKAPPMRRLYLVVRADLSPGIQFAQGAHALSAFAVRYPERHRDWHTENSNLIALSIADEAALEALMRYAVEAGVPVASFHEPDLEGELTACAFDEGIARKVSSLPLALRERPAKAA